MSAAPRLLVMIHGANLDMLGERPVEHYGTITLPALERLVLQVPLARRQQKQVPTQEYLRLNAKRKQKDQCK